MCSWQTFEILHIFCNSPPLQIGFRFHKVSCLNSCWHAQSNWKWKILWLQLKLKEFQSPMFHSSGPTKSESFNFIQTSKSLALGPSSANSMTKFRMFWWIFNHCCYIKCWICKPNVMRMNFPSKRKEGVLCLVRKKHCNKVFRRHSNYLSDSVTCCIPWK